MKLFTYITLTSRSVPNGVVRENGTERNGTLPNILPEYTTSVTCSNDFLFTKIFLSFIINFEKSPDIRID